MTSSGFFLPGDAPNLAYRAIRDRNTDPIPRARAFIEELWLRYCGHEDRHFLSDAQTHFLERFWEMYLAVTFMERDLSPSRAGGVGPESSCASMGQKIWLEAIAPGPGDGDDRVERPQPGVVTSMPTEQILLRFTNALASKRNRYLAAYEKGIVTDRECYVLAVNSAGIPHASLGNTLPFFVQAFLPIGAPTVVVDRSTGNMVDSYYARRETIVKAKGGEVSTAAFLDPEFSFLSAVLHSGADWVNRPAVLGDDFIILHNPTARLPLARSIFSWCRQYVFEDDELKLHAG